MKEDKKESDFELATYVEKGTDENGQEFSDEFITGGKLTREQKELSATLRIMQIALEFPKADVFIFADYGFSISTDYFHERYNWDELCSLYNKTEVTW